MAKLCRYFFFLIVFTLFSAPVARAVPPPDFIFNLGSQIVQFFSLALLLLSAIASSVFQLFRKYLVTTQRKIMAGVVGLLLIVSVAGMAAHVYGKFAQEKAYQDWLAESQGYHDYQEEQIILASTSTVITNKDFQTLLSQKKSLFILDARENLEYDNGHFPGALHIRMADLKIGRWKELPKNQTIYVLCWSGIRGKEVTDFLRAQGLTARFIEKGASGWVEFGGAWEGKIKFEETYTDPRYKKLFTQEQMKQQITSGVVLVDSREPERYKRGHMKGSINIPLLQTPTKDLERVFGQVRVGETVITICDEFVNCFDAKITGVELEKRGVTFLGRYSSPWEFPIVK